MVTTDFQYWIAQAIGPSGALIILIVGSWQGQKKLAEAEKTNDSIRQDWKNALQQNLSMVQQISDVFKEELAVCHLKYENLQKKFYEILEAKVRLESRMELLEQQQHIQSQAIMTNQASLINTQNEISKGPAASGSGTYSVTVSPDSPLPN